jgi:hypothetical protein
MVGLLQVSQYLNDLFELFGRLAAFRHYQTKAPELQNMHLYVAIYAYFHRYLKSFCASLH